jgi:hypothetical protein
VSQADPTSPSTADRLTLGQPSGLAVTTAAVAVTDREGQVMFLPWPPSAAGVVTRAHQNAGPVAAAGADVVTSGGWEPTVTLWDVTAHVPRWSVQPFDGRVTALCSQGGDILVAGADRDPNAPVGKGDAVGLRPARVLRIEAGADGTFAVGHAEWAAAGAIPALACGPGWLAAVDTADDSRVTVVRDQEPVRLVGETDVTALAGSGSDLVIASPSAVAIYDVGSGARREVTASPGDLTILAVALVGPTVVAATSEGIVAWPGGRKTGGGQPIALAAQGDSVFVLWPDRRLEQRDATGTVIARVSLP